MKREAPCLYKHSCGFDICTMEACDDYKAKKRGEPLYGDEKPESKQTKDKKETRAK